MANLADATPMLDPSNGETTGSHSQQLAGSKPATIDDIIFEDAPRFDPTKAKAPTSPSGQSTGSPTKQQTSKAKKNAKKAPRGAANSSSGHHVVEMGPRSQRKKKPKLLIRPVHIFADPQQDEIWSEVFAHEGFFEHIAKGKTESDAQFLQSSWCFGRMPVPLLFNSTLRQLVDMLMVFSCFYILIVIPMDVGFWREQGSSYSPLALAADIVLLTDLCLNLITAHRLPNNRVLTTLKDTAKAYLTSWFFPDLLSTIPWVVFANGTDCLPCRLLPLLKMMRTSQILLSRQLRRRIGSRLSAFLSPHPNAMSVLQLVGGFVLSLHFLACIWYLIGTWDSAGEDADSWTRRIDGLDDKFLNDGNFQGQAQELRYLVSLFWVTNAMSVGGDAGIVPRTPAEMLWAMVIYISGVAFFASVISTVGDILKASRQESNQKNQKLSQLRSLMHEREVPRFLREKYESAMISYMEDSRKNEKKARLNRFSLLESAPPSARMNLAVWLYSDILAGSPLLSLVKNPKDAKSLAELLLKMELRQLPRMTTLVEHHKPETIDNLYFFVTQGNVVVSTPDNATNVHQKHSPGFFLGLEVVLHNAGIHPGFSIPVVTKLRSKVTALIISKKELLEVLDESPKLRKAMEELALSWVRDIQAQIDSPPRRGRGEGGKRVNAEKKKQSKKQKQQRRQQQLKKRPAPDQDAASDRQALSASIASDSPNLDPKRAERSSNWRQPASSDPSSAGADGAA